VAWGLLDTLSPKLINPMVLALFKNDTQNAPHMSSQGSALSPVDAGGHSPRREVDVVSSVSDQVLDLDESVDIKRTQNGRIFFRTENGKVYSSRGWRGLCHAGLANVRHRREVSSPQRASDLA